MMSGVLRQTAEVKQPPTAERKEEDSLLMKSAHQKGPTEIARSRKHPDRRPPSPRRLFEQT